MERQDCDVIYSGALIANRDPAQVKSDLARLFKTDAVGIERLFTGQPVIIKRGVDPQTAEKYRAALEKAGAICEIRRHAPANAADGPQRPTIAPAGTILTTPAGVKPLVFDLSAISLAEPGVDLLEGMTTVTASPVFDLTGLSMAPTGADIDPRPPLNAATLPNIDKLTLAAPGSALLRPDEMKPSPLSPDMRGLGLSLENNTGPDAVRGRRPSLS